MRIKNLRPPAYFTPTRPASPIEGEEFSSPGGLWLAEPTPRRGGIEGVKRHLPFYYRQTRLYYMTAGKKKSKRSARTSVDRSRRFDIKYKTQYPKVNGVNS